MTRAAKRQSPARLAPEGVPSSMERKYVRHTSARLFENEFLERVSKIHPATPFVFYGPLVVGLLGWALWARATDWAYSLVFLPVGWVAWAFMEYALHRFILHWEGRGPLMRRLHTIIHGYHHQYPDDPDRLVMPLSASIPLGLVIGAALYALGSLRWTVPFFVGLVSGYMAYDFLHWSVHRGPLPGRWGRELRARHMAHHFAAPDRNFGISNAWVDVLFGTLRQRPARDEAAAPSEPPA